MHIMQVVDNDAIPTLGKASPIPPTPLFLILSLFHSNNRARNANKFRASPKRNTPGEQNHRTRRTKSELRRGGRVYAEAGSYVETVRTSLNTVTTGCTCPTGAFVDMTKDAR